MAELFPSRSTLCSPPDQGSQPIEQREPPAYYWLKIGVMPGQPGSGARAYRLMTASQYGENGSTIKRVDGWNFWMIIATRVDHPDSMSYALPYNDIHGDRALHAAGYSQLHASLRIPPALSRRSCRERSETAQRPRHRYPRSTKASVSLAVPVWHLEHKVPTGAVGAAVQRVSPPMVRTEADGSAGR